MNTTPARDPILLVDLETGDILEAPATATVSRKYVESHPFMRLWQKFGGTSQPKFVVAGPHADRVANGHGGTDFILYAVERELAGFLVIRREK